MGDHNVVPDLDEQKLQAFMKALLDDLRALDYMLDNISLKPVSRRIGAEQEMFLVDIISGRRPFPCRFSNTPEIQD